MNENVLRQCRLFQGMQMEELKFLLGCLKAKEKDYKKGSYIYRMNDHISSIGIVLEGQIAIENDDVWGNRTILDICEVGMIFGQTYACVPSEPLLINVVAMQDSKVLFLDLTHIISTCEKACVFHHKLIQNLLLLACQKNMALSRRSLYTAHKNIKDRVLSYLSDQAKRKGTMSFEIRFNRNELADYLNVERSALSNTLSKMQKDGILKYNKNHFTLLKTNL